MSDAESPRAASPKWTSRVNCRNRTSHIFAYRKMALILNRRLRRPRRPQIKRVASSLSRSEIQAESSCTKHEKMPTVPFPLENHGLWRISRLSRTSYIWNPKTKMRSRRGSGLETRGSWSLLQSRITGRLALPKKRNSSLAAWSKFTTNIPKEIFQSSLVSA